MRLYRIVVGHTISYLYVVEVLRISTIDRVANPEICKYIHKPFNTLVQEPVTTFRVEKAMYRLISFSQPACRVNTKGIDSKFFKGITTSLITLLISQVLETFKGVLINISNKASALILYAIKLYIYGRSFVKRSVASLKKPLKLKLYCISNIYLLFLLYRRVADIGNYIDQLIDLNKALSNNLFYYLNVQKYYSISSLS